MYVLAGYPDEEQHTGADVQAGVNRPRATTASTDATGAITPVAVSLCLSRAMQPHDFLRGGGLQTVEARQPLRDLTFGEEALFGAQQKNVVDGRLR